MKLYVVISNTMYGEDMLEGVFSSKGKAEEAIGEYNKLVNPDEYNFQIAERNLDEIKSSGT